MSRIIAKLYLLIICMVFAFSCCTDPGGEMECIEDKKEDCVCTTQYDPVCGCNGKTYGNSCEAYCNGIADYTEGACE